MTTDDLRQRIADTIRSIPHAGWTYAPGQEKFDHHKDRDHPGHTYSITCALCVSDITALANALLPLVAAERADAARQAADDLTAAANPRTERRADVSWATDRIRARAQAFRDAAHAVHPDAFGYGGPDHYDAWTDAEQRLQAIAKKEEASADNYTSAAQIHTPLVRTEARADHAHPGLGDSPISAIRDAIADFDFAGYGAEIDTDPAAAWIGDLAASIAGVISGGTR